MYSYGPPHMAVQKQDDQLEHTYSSYVRIRDVFLKTYLGRWTIGRSGERGSGISVLPARYDDDELIWPIDKTLSGATTPSQSGPGNDDNKGVLRILQSSSITEASSSDCLVSYPRYSLGKSFSSAEKQWVYSTALTDWAMAGWPALTRPLFQKRTSLMNTTLLLRQFLTSRMGD